MTLVNFQRPDLPASSNRYKSNAVLPRDLWLYPSKLNEAASHMKFNALADFGI